MSIRLLNVTGFDPLSTVCLCTLNRSQSRSSLFHPVRHRNRFSRSHISCFSNARLLQNICHRKICSPPVQDLSKPILKITGNNRENAPTKSYQSVSYNSGSLTRKYQTFFYQYPELVTVVRCCSRYKMKVFEDDIFTIIL